MPEEGRPGTDATLPAAGDPDAVSPPRADAGIGEVIDHYAISGPLGAGGMGTVYLARDTRLGRPVALKVLRTRADVGSDACRELCARLLREARAMASLSHPNLLAVHDVGTAAGRVYIVMEYVDGWTLRGWASESPRRWDERLAVLIAAGRGLAEAHAAGIVHRDFKPDNVLVSRRGRVLVGDFGLARVGAELDGAPVPSCHAADDPVVTRAGAVLGSPAYMAPEQHRGEPSDVRSDIFSFAVTAWELLYGVHPFRGRTAEELSAAVHEGELRDVPAASETPRAFAEILRRALTPVPAARHHAMPEVLEALENAAKRRRAGFLGLLRRNRRR